MPSIRAPALQDSARPGESKSLPSIYVIRQEVQNSYLVRQRDRRRRRELTRVLAAVLPIAMALLGYVWINLRLVNIGYEVGRLERELEREEDKQREMLVEEAYLSSPARVRGLASERLGMVDAELERLLFAEEIQ